MTAACDRRRGWEPNAAAGAAVALLLFRARDVPDRQTGHPSSVTPKLIIVVAL